MSATPEKEPNTEAASEHSPTTPSGSPAPPDLPDEVLECHLHLLAPDRAQLWVDAAGDIGRKPRFDGHMELRPDLLDGLLPKEQNAMGSRLFDALLPEGQMTLDAYRGASRWARDEGLRLALKLHFDAEVPEWMHDLPWELLFDPRWRLALGRSESTAVERRIDMRRPKNSSEDPGAWATDRSVPEPVMGKLRVLIAVANPTTGPSLGNPTLDREHEAWTLVSALKRLEDLVDWRMLEEPPTPENLRRALAEGPYHVLHLVAHGRIPEHARLRVEGKKAEVLLAGDGDRGQWLAEPSLRAMLGDLPELRLVTLVACHDGIETHADPFHGLPWRLVRGGVPAVVTARRALSVDGARRLTEQLYRCLALEGRLDTAMAEVRDRLQHGGSSALEGWAPAHFVGRARGTLWHAPDRIRERLEADTQALEIARLRIERERSEQLHALTKPEPLPQPIEPKAPIWLVALLVLLVMTTAGLYAWKGKDGPWPFLGRTGGPGVIAEQDSSAAPLDPEATRRALPLYEAACAEGDARSCARVGAIYEHARAGSRDLLRAVSFYSRACEGNEATACYHQGQLLERSESGEDSTSPEVGRLYEAACKGGDNRGCRRLALLEADLEIPQAGDSVAALGEEPGLAEPLTPEATAAGAGAEVEESDEAGPRGGDVGDVESGEARAARRTSESEEASPRDARPRVAVVDGERVELPGSADGSSEERGGSDSEIEPRAPRVIEASVSAYEVGGDGSQGRAFARARGNVYRVDLPTELIEVEVWLDFYDVQDLTFTILEGDRPDGRFATVQTTHRTIEGRGPDWYSSGMLDLRLEAGHYYLVTTAWNGEAGYAYGSIMDHPALPAQGTFFGWVLHGHTDLAPLLPEVESEVSDRALYRQRLLTRHPYRVAGELREDYPEDFGGIADASEREDGVVELGERGERDTVEDGNWRGNLVRLDRALRLGRIEASLGIEGRATLELRLYSATGLHAPFERQFQASTTVFGEGEGWYGIDLNGRDGGMLLAGDRLWAAVLRVVSENGEAGDHFYGIGGGQELPFGRLVQGLTEADPGRSLENGPDVALYQQRWVLVPESTEAPVPPEEETRPAAETDPGGAL